MTRPAAPPTARFALAACAAAACLATGCHWGKKGEANPWRGRETLPATTTKDDLVRHINRQSLKMTGWQCSRMTVQVANNPLTAEGMIAVQYPRQLRLKAKQLLPVADVGSNADRVWCWVNPSLGGPSHETLTCRHASFEAVKARAERTGGVQIPFDPDWLMEVLGVAPLDPSAVTLQKAPGGGPIWHLVSHRTDASGRRVLRVIDVDREHGQVLAHELRDAATGRPIARAVLQDHRRCEAADVVLPHSIHITWPAANLPGMTLRLGEIEVNPRDLPEELWSIPAGRKARHLDRGGEITTAAACDLPL